MEIEKRKYVADAFNEEVSMLEKAYARSGMGAQLAEFLRREIVTHADEGTLLRILGAVRRELADIAGQTGAIP